MGEESNGSRADDRGTGGTSDAAYTLFDDSVLPLKFPAKLTLTECN